MNLDTHPVQLGDELRYGKTGLDVDLAVIAGDRKHKLAPNQVETLISHKSPLLLRLIQPQQKCRWGNIYLRWAHTQEVLWC